VLQNCHEAYYREARRRSPAMLYAMQSILPFELHEGLLPLEMIDRIKLSTRNSDIGYVVNCLESYLGGNEERWIRQSVGNYYLWGRLAWHNEFYATFDLAQIMQWKRTWYETGVWPETPPLTGAVSVDLDLTGCSQPLSRQQVAGWNRWIDGLSAGLAWEKGVCYLAPDDVALGANARLLREQGWQVWLHCGQGAMDDEAMLREAVQRVRPDGVLAEDEDVLRWASAQSLPVALGNCLTSLQAQTENAYAKGNGGSYGHDLVTESLRQRYEAYRASFAVTNMPPQGLQIPAASPVRLKARVST
jgi:hypothetical protein